MANNIYGVNKTPSSVSLNFVAAYITVAEPGYRNPFAGVEPGSFDYDSVGFLHTVAGNGVVQLGGESHAVGKDDCVFMRYRDLKLLAGDKAAEWRFYCLWFFLDNLSIDYGTVFSLPELPREREYIERIVSLLNDNDYYALCQANALGQLLLGELLAATGGTAANTPYYREIRGVVSYINRHLSEELSVSALAARCSICEKHFRTMFSRQVGVPPKQYILRTKLDRAAFLLTFTPLSVTEISDELAFLSPAYFTARFKRRFGLTPTEYRRSH